MSGIFRTTLLDALRVAVGCYRYTLEKGKKCKPNKVERLLRTPATAKSALRPLFGRSDRGRRLHRLLPNIQQMMENKAIIASQGLVYFLIGHSPYPTYLQKWICDTWEHLNTWTWTAASWRNQRSKNGRPPAVGQSLK